MISLWDELQKGPFQTKYSSKTPKTTGNEKKKALQSGILSPFFKNIISEKPLLEGTDAEEVTCLTWVAHYTFSCPPSPNVTELL